MSAELGPILLFDGVCNLCSSSVQFVIERDPEAKVRFASLQSEFASRTFAELKIPGDYLDSIVLLEQGKVYYKSAAALRVCRYLNGGWPLLRVFMIVPGPLRDVVYDWVARNRYRWFGKKETCWIPTPELRERFITT